jgi:hypothetical protein
VGYLDIPVYVHGRRKKSSTGRKSNDGRIKEAWWAEPTDRPLQRNECSVARARHGVVSETVFVGWAGVGPARWAVGQRLGFFFFCSLPFLFPFSDFNSAIWIQTYFAGFWFYDLLQNTTNNFLAQSVRGYFIGVLHM